MFVWCVVCVGQLVPVGLQALAGLPRPAYLPSGLLGAFHHCWVVWIPYLEAGFPLRCFQRLPFPNVANQPCPGRDNWHTRGSSVPVLSYKVGNRIGDIGAAIQEYAESHGYGVVRDLVGHGVGPTMHEEPMVPHYGRAGRGLRLREGMVLTIEPMINTGTWEIDTDFETGWAHKTLDGGLSCQYEHQFVITKDGPVILTSQGEEGTY